MLISRAAFLEKHLPKAKEEEETFVGDFITTLICVIPYFIFQLDSLANKAWCERIRITIRG